MPTGSIRYQSLIESKGNRHRGIVKIFTQVGQMPTVYEGPWESETKARNRLAKMRDKFLSTAATAGSQVKDNLGNKVNGQRVQDQN